MRAIRFAFRKPPDSDCSIAASRRKCRDERFLSGGFHRVRPVVCADPRDRVFDGMTGEDGEAGQRGTGPAVTAETADFHPLPTTDPLEEVAQRGENGSR